MAAGRTDEEQKLREEVMLEIEKKFKVCSNPTYQCSLPRVDDYEYCMRHILQDPSGHYKQCTYVFGNGRRCTNALPKYDSKKDQPKTIMYKDPTMTSLCFEHSRKAQLNKTRCAVGKFQAVDSNEVLLNNLAQHLNLKEAVKRAKIQERNQDEEIDVVSSNELTFVGHKHVQSLDSFVGKSCKRRILDYASDSSSNECVLHPNLSNTVVGLEFETSDNDSVDSDEDDLLKHAEIFSRQEIVRISEAKLTKLQNFYIEQVNHLHLLLKDRRRKYLVALRKERELLCEYCESIHEQAKETPRERMLYKQLKAYNTYHQRHGVEAVLHKKLKDKRAKLTDSFGYKPPIFTKCVYSESGIKCSLRALPCSKYCRKHILQDKKQTLFRACSVDRGGVVCKEAIPCIFDESTCVLHMEFPDSQHFVQKKYDLEPDNEAKNLSKKLKSDIKNEFIESPNQVYQKSIFSTPETPSHTLNFNNDFMSSPNVLSAKK